MDPNRVLRMSHSSEKLIAPSTPDRKSNDDNGLYNSGKKQSSREKNKRSFKNENNMLDANDFFGGGLNESRVSLSDDSRS